LYVVFSIRGKFLWYIFLCADVLKFDLKDAGLLAALPYLVMGIMVQVGGFLADWLRSQGHLTTTQVQENSYRYLSQEEKGWCLKCLTLR